MNQLLLVFFLLSCQEHNSNSFDEDKFQPIDSNSPIGVLRNRCISCHTGTHDWWSSLTTNSDWANTLVDGRLYVVPGDFSGSYIISRLKNFGSDMPEGGAALTDEELDILQNWIENDTF